VHFASAANLLSLSRDKYILWRDLFSDQRIGDPYKFDSGVFRYDEKKLERFSGWRVEGAPQSLRDDLDKFKRELPPPYPYLHTIRDNEKPANARVHIRGSADNLGDEVPRHFCRFCVTASRQHSIREAPYELAAAIANPGNPLTARVMVNRIWQHHFGWASCGRQATSAHGGAAHSSGAAGLFGRSFHGERVVDQSPAREIMLSATYALSAAKLERNFPET